MLVHIINGDAMAEAFAAAGVPGEVIVWREAAIDGPIAVDMSTAEIREARAEWFERDLDVPADEFRREFDDRERALADLAERADVELVLWFERDLFCELHLLDLLGRSADRAWTVAVVHPPTLALPAESLPELFEARRACSPSERGRARAAWAALASEDPREFQAFGDASDSPWFAELIAGMQRERSGCFADPRGLSRFDAVVLERLGDQACSPGELFRAVREHTDTRGLGLGDLQVWQRLAMLVERGLIDEIDPANLRASAEAIAILAGRASASVPPRGWIGAAQAADWRRIDDQVVRI